METKRMMKIHFSFNVSWIKGILFLFAFILHFLMNSVDSITCREFHTYFKLHL